MDRLRWRGCVFFFHSMNGCGCWHGYWHSYADNWNIASDDSYSRAYVGMRCVLGISIYIMEKLESGSILIFFQCVRVFSVVDIFRCVVLIQFCTLRCVRSKFLENDYLFYFFFFCRFTESTDVTPVVSSAQTLTPYTRLCIRPVSELWVCG